MSVCPAVYCLSLELYVCLCVFCFATACNYKSYWKPEPTAVLQQQAWRKHYCYCIFVKCACVYNTELLNRELPIICLALWRGIMWRHFTICIIIFLTDVSDEHLWWPELKWWQQKAQNKKQSKKSAHKAGNLQSIRQKSEIQTKWSFITRFEN